MAQKKDGNEGFFVTVSVVCAVRFYLLFFVFAFSAFYLRCSIAEGRKQECTSAKEHRCDITRFRRGWRLRRRL